MEDPLPAGCAVDLGRFVELTGNGAQSRGVYDGVPAGFLPNAGPGVHMPEIIGQAAEVRGIAFSAEEPVEIAVEARIEARKEYDGEEGLVLRAKNIKSTVKPEEELVYF